MSTKILAQKIGISVGNIKLTDRALLAPMSGLTDSAFRRTARSLGADVTITEMTASRAIIAGEMSAANLTVLMTERSYRSRGTTPKQWHKPRNFARIAAL